MQKICIGEKNTHFQKYTHTYKIRIIFGKICILKNTHNFSMLKHDYENM